ncbi:MAG: PQQ-binding-like beta-propeller repeat protein [Vicinamibacteraceae bacterium]
MTKRRRCGTRLACAAAGLAAGVCLSVAASSSAPVAGQAPPASAEAPQGGDWPEWRGPRRDGRSAETGLPERWSPAGENLAWRAPYGGRSAPVIHDNRLYLQNVAGDAKTAQERVMCLDANTGKLIWERKFSLYLSDVPQHRAGWASPSVDPATGNVYVYTVGAQLNALSRDGKPLWSRSLPEEFGVITTHGGRTMSPVIDGDRVVVSGLSAAWGDMAPTSNRFIAFDKATGTTVWVSAPQKWHYDTNYSTPVVAEINGNRLLIVGGTDGVIHALQATTGKPVWQWHVSKRALNNSVLVDGTTVYVTHSEENTDTTQMGMVAAIDGAARGEVGAEQVKWVTRGFLGGYTSPVIDEARLYHVDNSAILGAFDRATGKALWRHTLGTIQKGSPVLADGKLYVGTENGRFYILRPRADGVDVLDEDWLGKRENPEAIVSSPAVSHGRIYVTSMEATYAIGPRDVPQQTAGPAPAAAAEAESTAAPAGKPATLLVVPYETRLAPGETTTFRAQVYDANGRLLGEQKPTWAVEGGGSIGADGTYKAPADGPHALTVKATLGSVAGVGRVRVLPPLPWSIDFESQQRPEPPAHWLNATGKFRFIMRDVAGSRVLFREANDAVARRVRAYLGPPDWSDYTVEADVRTSEQRRRMGDVGLIAQRYVLVLFGNSQRIELHPWQAADEMTVRAPFEWKPDTWYRIKLRVENLDKGVTRVQGKAWPTGQPEPAKWLVEKMDSIGHREGSPGLYSDALSDMAFDNINVYRNNDAPQKSSH